MILFGKVLLVFVIELILILFFRIITPKPIRKKGIDYMSISKGVIERAFLMFGFLNNLPHVITLFGALKLGTRLKHGDKEESEAGLKTESLYNDYYLIGNFVSVFVSIVYFLMFKY